VVVTPHTSGQSDVFHERFWTDSVEMLIALAQNGRPIGIVNAGVTPSRHDANRHGDCLPSRGDQAGT
jgi:hypothetical protein